MTTGTDITPDTHFKAPLWRVAALLAIVASATGAAVGAWAALNGKLESHMTDKTRHLDPDWQFDHGRPVGKNDLDVYRAEQNRRLDDIAADAKAGREMIRQLTLSSKMRSRPAP